MILSKSKILVYLDCPRKFMFRYINEIPDQDNQAAAIGRKVHDYAEKLFDAQNMDMFLEPKIIEASDEELFFIKNLIKLEKERWNALKDKKWFRPILRETMVEYGNFHGIVDRIQYDPENGTGLLDYKTGNVKKLDEYMFELSGYAYLVEKSPLFGRKIDYVGIIDLKRGKVLKRNITDEDKIAAIDVINKIHKLINEENFKKKVGNHCYFCNKVYKGLCWRLDNNAGRFDNSH